MSGSLPEVSDAPFTDVLGSRVTLRLVRTSFKDPRPSRRGLAPSGYRAVVVATDNRDGLSRERHGVRAQVFDLAQDPIRSLGEIPNVLSRDTATRSSDGVDRSRLRRAVCAGQLVRQSSRGAEFPKPRTRTDLTTSLGGHRSTRPRSPQARGLRLTHSDPGTNRAIERWASEPTPRLPWGIGRQCSFRATRRAILAARQHAE